MGEGTVAVVRSSPVSVIGGHSFTTISLGSHLLALKSDGSAWSWGTGTSGELGQGTTAVGRSSPVSVIGGHLFSAIAVGSNDNIALKSNGSAWSWGSSSGGQLGDNFNFVRSSPVSVVGGHLFTKISAGNVLSLALKSDGSAWSWGTGTSGQLGEGTVAVNRSSPVSVIGGHSFNNISAGTSFSLALKSDGSAWAWGLNSSDQLGDGTAILKSSPVSVIGGHLFAKISAGALNSYALKSDGSVWAWGSRASGALGNNTDNLVVPPVSVVGGHSFSNLTAGNNFALALKSSDGSAWAWGAGSQLGQNTDTNNRSSPVSVVGGHSFSVITIGVADSVIALKSDGSAWAWGTNLVGQLGDNSVLSRSSPVSVIGGHLFTKISSGGGSGNGLSLALKSDGSAWAWGSGGSGQLGQNTDINNRSSPASVVGGHSFTAISAGALHTMALKSDGSAWAWGFPTSGQLGDNQSAAGRSSPVSVVGNHTFSAISAGTNFSTALKSSDGSVWAWGLGTSGQLGQNTDTNNRSSPVSIVGGHSFSAIASSLGSALSIALKSSDGSVWAWGVGTSGQMGDGLLVSRSSPVSVIGGNSFTKIAAGIVNSYGLKSDGSVWAWGSRTSGALGNNTDPFVSSPVQIIQPTTAIKTINGVPYAKYIFNDITTGSITVPSIKTVNGVSISNTKTINGNL
jgi:alpha-tubulin suppressor-like RCC1 family protein